MTSTIPLAHLPMRCIKRFFEEKGHVEVDVVADEDGCVAVLQDIILSGKFCINQVPYQVLMVHHGPRHQYRIFQEGDQLTPPHLTLTAAKVGD